MKGDGKLKELLQQAFQQLEKTEDTQQALFIEDYYKETYQDESKATSVYEQVNTFFKRMTTNHEAIQTYKQKGYTRNKWMEEKLSYYEQQHPGVAASIVNTLQKNQADSVQSYGIEQEAAPYTAAYSGVGKKVAMQLLNDNLTAHTYVEGLKNEQVYHQLETDASSDAATVRYFEAPLDSSYDELFKQVGTAVLLRLQKTGEMKWLENKTPTEIAAIVDKTYTYAKVCYKIAKGDMQASYATDYLIDRGVALLETLLHEKAGEVGGKMGEKVGGAIGAVFGPVGKAIGATLGKVTGEMAGHLIGEKLIEGVHKITSYAKEKIGAVANRLATAVTSKFNVATSSVGRS